MQRIHAVFALLLLLPLAACGGHSGSGAGILPSASNARALSATAASGTVPAHVQTATYLWSSTETATNPATYAPYLTWAYTLYNKMATTQAAGIKVIFYVNPMMPQKGDATYTSLQSAYPAVQAKTCSGSTITTYSGNGLLADPRTTQAAAYMTAQVNAVIQGKILPSNPGYTHPWDAMFIDNDGALYGVSALPCNYDPASWGTAMDAAVSAAGQPAVVNSLSTSVANAPMFANYVNGENTAGGEYEECFMNNTWAAEEQSQISVIANLKSAGKAPGPGWWCYVDNTNADAATVIPQRMFDYASFLLTYDPDYSVFQESFTTPSTFQVFPETGFVPLQPASTPSNISQLQTSSGAYVQNYGACYYRGSALGPCEVAVNPGTSSVALPNSFMHSMAISGEGVLDGGQAVFTGGPVTSLAPKTAAILIAPAPAPTPSPTPTATATPSLSGTVDYMKFFGSTGEFQVQNASGYSWVCTNSSTVWSGPALAVGESAAIVSSAKSGTCVTAAGVTLSSASSAGSTLATPAPTPTPTPTGAPTAAPTAAPALGTTTLTGSVTYCKYYSSTGGFQLKTASTTLWVYGPQPYTAPVAVGKTVTVTGTLNNSGTMIATSLTF